jgi:hypothetical protein
LSARVRSIVVLVGETDDETRDEAFRAAVGLTLRGAHVHVVVTDPHAPLGASAQRARATLELMGHRVTLAPAGLDELARADAVEVWGAAPPAVAPGASGVSGVSGGTVHLVRPGRRAAVSAPTAAVLHLPPVLDRADADRLLDQLLAADRVVVW